MYVNQFFGWIRLGEQDGGYDIKNEEIRQVDWWA